jgi:hypothetical protein
MILLCFGAYAVIPDPFGRRYDGIAPSNIFRLKPETQLQSPSPLQTPLPVLKLTGVTTMLGYKLALLKTQPLVKPGQPSAEQNLMLAEGQSEGDIEVLEIDEKSGRVKVSNSGTIMTLTFEKDGLKQTPPLPTAPPNLGSNVPVPTPTGINPPPQSGMVYPGQKPIPSRYHPTGMVPSPVTLPGGASPAPANPTPASVPAQPQTNISPAQLTSDEQAVISELEREMLARTNALLNSATAFAATSTPPARVLAPQ